MCKLIIGRPWIICQIEEVAEHTIMLMCEDCHFREKKFTCQYCENIGIGLLLIPCEECANDNFYKKLKSTCLKCVREEEQCDDCVEEIKSLWIQEKSMLDRNFKPVCADCQFLIEITEQTDNG